MAMLEAASVQSDAIDLLTPRERECLRLVYEHLSSKEIGRRLGISKHTVDTHVDKARQRLGAQDRYDAARRVAAFERMLTIPTPSGPDTNGIFEDHELRPDPPGLREIDHEPFQRRPPAAARGPGLGLAPGVGRLPADLADAASAGDFDPRLYLGAGGAAARGPVRSPIEGGYHPDAGFGPAQAGALEAAGDGLARALLSRVDAYGRILPAGPAAWGRSGNALGPAAKIGLILLIAIASAVAFGGVLAGLHALRELV